MARTKNDNTTAQERLEKAVNNTPSGVANSMGNTNSSGSLNQGVVSGRVNVGSTGTTTTNGYTIPTTSGANDSSARNRGNEDYSDDDYIVKVAENLGKQQKEQEKVTEPLVEGSKALLETANATAPTRSEAYNNALAGWNDAKTKGVFYNAMWEDANGMRDAFNDYDTYTRVLNRIFKDYGLTADELQLLGDVITKDSGSNTTIRKLNGEGYRLGSGLSNSGQLSYINAQKVYEAQADAQKQQAQAEYQAKINALAEAERKAQQQAEASNRLAYIQSVLGQNNLNQQLASQGINGGATESALLQLASNYGNQVNSTNNSLADLLYGYGNDRVQAQYDLASAKSLASSNALSNIDQALLQLMGKEEEAREKAQEEAKKSGKTTEDVPTLDDLLKTRESLANQGGSTTYTDDQIKQYYPQAYQDIMGDNEDDETDANGNRKPFNNGYAQYRAEAQAQADATPNPTTPTDTKSSSANDDNYIKISESDYNELLKRVQQQSPTITPAIALEFAEANKNNLTDAQYKKLVKEAQKWQRILNNTNRSAFG